MDSERNDVLVFLVADSLQATTTPIDSLLSLPIEFDSVSHQIIKISDWEQWAFAARTIRRL
jgi:hypothetical protein